MLGHEFSGNSDRLSMPGCGEEQEGSTLGGKAQAPGLVPFASVYPVRNVTPQERAQRLSEP